MRWENGFKFSGALISTVAVAQLLVAAKLWLGPAPQEATILRNSSGPLGNSTTIYKPGGEATFANYSSQYREPAVQCIYKCTSIDWCEYACSGGEADPEGIPEVCEEYCEGDPQMEDCDGPPSNSFRFENQTKSP